MVGNAYMFFVSLAVYRQNVSRVRELRAIGTTTVSVFCVYVVFSLCSRGVMKVNDCTKQIL